MSTLNVSNAAISNSIITTNLIVNGNVSNTSLNIGSVALTYLAPIVGYNTTNTVLSGLTHNYYTIGNWNGDTTFFTAYTPNTVTNYVIDINASVLGTEYSTDSFNGYFYANTTGQYQFYINCDDIATIWIGANAASYTNTNYLATATYAGDSSANVSLVANTYYPIFIAMGSAGAPNYMNIGITGPTYANTSSFSGIFYSGNISTPIYGANTIPTISVGSSSINSTAITVPSLYLSGAAVGTYSGYGAVVNTQIFTANGTWTNPYNDVTNPIRSTLSGNEQVFVMMWGAGGNGSGSYGGGGGGACNIGTFRLADLASTITATVGIGGGGSTSGASILGSLAAYAGSTASTGGGGGGGIISTGSTAAGGFPLGGTSASTGGTSTFGGGGGVTSGGAGTGGSSIFGGGGGSTNGTKGGITIFGGAGGPGSAGFGSGSGPGSSIFGGASGTTGGSLDGVAPGGGAAGYTSNFGVGGAGEIRVWVIK